MPATEVDDPITRQNSPKARIFLTRRLGRECRRFARREIAHALVPVICDYRTDGSVRKQSRRGTRGGLSRRHGIAAIAPGGRLAGGKQLSAGERRSVLSIGRRCLRLSR